MMAPIHSVPFGPMHHVAPPRGGQLPRPFVDNFLGLELRTQKEEALKGMAKEDRSFFCV